MTESSRAAEPLVGVVVLNWRRREETLHCLASLAQLTYARWFLVLIDNGCADFSDEEVAQLVPGGRYVRSATNLGFAGGANVGMRTALEAGADCVWFLNNDAQPEPEALGELMAVEQTAAIAGAKIVRTAEPRRLDSVALSVDLGSGRILLLGHDEEDRGQYDGLRDVAAVTGCAMLVSRAACAQLGGSDESFFAYLEDADLCLRARAAGLRVAAAPRARVHHARAAATGGRQSVDSLYYATRNHLRLIDRHGTGSAWSGRLRLLTVTGLNVAYAARPGAGTLPERLGAVLRGVRDYWRGVTGPG